MRLAFVFALAACSADPAQSPLDNARARWETNGYVAYSFRWQESCGNCSADTMREIQILVVENQITSATYTDDQSATTPERRDQLKTIDGVFDEIQLYIDGDADVFDIDYDATLGWPARVLINYSTVGDAGFAVFIKDVYPLMR